MNEDDNFRNSFQWTNLCTTQKSFPFWGCLEDFSEYRKNSVNIAVSYEKQYVVIEVSSIGLFISPVKEDYSMHSPFSVRERIRHGSSIVF